MGRYRIGAARGKVAAEWCCGSGRVSLAQARVLTRATAAFVGCRTASGGGAGCGGARWRGLAQAWRERR